ncbi:MAG: 2-phospho-L-lactate guanylyltransferase [Methanoregula sp.]|uniref:2-phospho-L-lactate guanylyltransferase n=1 Tax=Methanoregula sp. TaxID=2052170 RepID=UPI003BB20774
MCPHALIPFKPAGPKSRLSGILSPEEREAFARAMLEDVIAAAKDANCSPVIVATELYDSEDIQVTIADKDLSGALNEVLSQAVGSVLILMADLPLATGPAIQRVVTTKSNIAIVPGRGGGTNAIFVAEPAKFHVDYYGMSFSKHLRIAQEAGLSCEVIDSFLLHTDIDEEEDLVELLTHGTGKSRKYLEDLGFTLSAENGRVSVKRKNVSSPRA